MLRRLQRLRVCGHPVNVLGRCSRMKNKQWFNSVIPLLTASEFQHRPSYSPSSPRRSSNSHFGSDSSGFFISTPLSPSVHPSSISNEWSARYHPYNVYWTEIQLMDGQRRCSYLECFETDDQTSIMVNGQIASQHSNDFLRFSSYYSRTVRRWGDVGGNSDTNAEVLHCSQGERCELIVFVICHDLGLSTVRGD